LSNTIIQAGINTFGDVVVAGGVASNNITILLYAVLASFYSACVSFVGQCYGAQKFKRIDGVFTLSTVICASFVIAAAIFITLKPEWFIGIFNNEPDVIKMGTPKLIIISWSYVLYGISEVAIGCLRGMRKSVIPTTINVLCVCVLRVIWVWFICPLDATNPILLYWCYPVSYIVSTTALLIYYFHCRRALNVIKPVSAQS